MMANVSRVITGMAISGWSTALKKCRFERNPDQWTFRVSTAEKSMNLACLHAMFAVHRTFVSVVLPNSFISGLAARIGSTCPSCANSFLHSIHWIDDVNSARVESRRLIMAAPVG